jgi:predicted GNAT superfamily acetyltransferase
VGRRNGHRLIDSTAQRMLGRHHLSLAREQHAYIVRPPATLPVVLLRALEASDLDAALALNNANVPALNELDRTELARLVDLSLVSLAAEVDGAFVGFCVVLGPGVDYASLNYRWFSARYDDFAYLDRIAVDTTLRRAGVGRAFYDELRRRFTSTRPALLCEVNIRPRNDASLDFHHAIGFREVGQQDTDEGRKRVSLLELDLGPVSVDGNSRTRPEV